MYFSAITGNAVVKLKNIDKQLIGFKANEDLFSGN